jgi:entericidin B
LTQSNFKQKESRMKPTLVKTVIGLVLGASFALGLTGCNTIAGIGRDVERAGEVVQDAAKKR